MPGPLALLAPAGKFALNAAAQTGLWYGASELLHHFTSSETGQQEAEGRPKK